MVNYWVVRAGQREDNIADIVQHRSLIGIGWERIGNLRDFKRGDTRSMKAKIQEVYPYPDVKRPGSDARELHRFAYEIVENDIVVTPIPSTRSILIGRVIGDYRYNARPKHYLLTNTRKVDWLRTDVSYDESPVPLNGQLTVWDANPYAHSIDSLIPDAPPTQQFTTTRQPGSTERASTSERRSTRSSRSATPETIAPNDSSGEWHPDEQQLFTMRTGLRRQRNADHQLLVRNFAQVLPYEDLKEDPFDYAALTPRNSVLLAEMKTLDGTQEDERRQVRAAVGQLLYYEGLCLPAEFGGQPVTKVAVFDKQPSTEHTGWMESLDVAVVWQDEDGRFVGLPPSIIG